MKMRKLICMLCAAAMAVTLFGCKPDSGEVLSNGYAESAVDSLSNTASEISSKSPVESDVPKDNMNTELSVPENSESAISLSESKDVFNSSSFISTTAAPDQVMILRQNEQFYLYVDGEPVANKLVTWYADNTVNVSVDNTGKIIFKRDSEVVGCRATVTAILANDNLKATFEYRNESVFAGHVDSPYKFSDYPYDCLMYFARYGVPYPNDDPLLDTYGNEVYKLTDNNTELYYYAAFAITQYDIIDRNTHQPTVVYQVGDNDKILGKIRCEKSIISYDGNQDDLKYVHITWSSSDESVATVDRNGVVTFHNKGIATITATINDQFGDIVYSDKTVTIQYPIRVI